MKKLFFLCTFLFISMQIQAQLCVVKCYVGNDYFHIDVYHSGETAPTQYTYDDYSFPDDNFVVGIEQTIINILGGIMSDGYELIKISDFDMWAPVEDDGIINYYYLAVPWTTVGLTETNSSELDLSVSPNPANDYINVEVDFKSQPSELVLISEGGYVYFKKDMSNILSGQEFTLDISNVPAGKYLVTIKDDKQFLTPKKLIVF